MIKPCPFCGGKAVLERIHYHLLDDSFIVMCEECGGEADTQEEAIEAWNKRLAEARQGDNKSET